MKFARQISAGTGAFGSGLNISERVKTARDFIRAEATNKPRRDVRKRTRRNLSRKVKFIATQE